MANPKASRALQEILEKAGGPVPPQIHFAMFYVLDRFEDIERLTEQVSRVEHLLRKVVRQQGSILKAEEEIAMAGPRTQEVINQLVEESRRNTNATNTAINQLHTLLDQVEANKDDPEVLQTVLDTFRANDEALAASVTSGSSSAPDPVGNPKPVDALVEEPNDAPHSPIAAEGPATAKPVPVEQAPARAQGEMTPANEDAVRLARKRAGAGKTKR